MKVLQSARPGMNSPACMILVFAGCVTLLAQAGISAAWPLSVSRPSISAAPEKKSLQVLSARDSQTYKKIFALQEAGEMAAADAQIKRLSDKILLGHVLYQRYIHPAYKSSFGELENWLDLYADHPGADRIYALAVRRVPADFEGTLAEPESGGYLAAAAFVPKIYTPSKKRDGAQEKSFRQFNGEILALAADYKIDESLKKLEKKSGTGFLDQTEYDILQAKIAAAALYSGRLDKAYNLARISMRKSGENVPLAGWIAGLAAWKKGQYGPAAQYFEMAANSPYASEWMRAGASLWAARAYWQNHDLHYAAFLKQAAENPRSFYGLIATHMLRRESPFMGGISAYTKQYHNLLASESAGRRALALIDAGQSRWAEAEFMTLDTGNPEIRKALLSYAAFAKLPVLAMQIGGAETVPYPQKSWMPEQAYTIDPALIHAIAHQESRFDPNALSPKGAMGLMQLMPSTAVALADDAGLTGYEHQRLRDPRTNIELGQRYLQDLLKDKNVGGDLVSLLMAYNAGPGNLARWKRQWQDVEDSLLFVEIIPSGQTRHYVKQVLANYWVNTLREQSLAPTLDAMAAGKVPLYSNTSPSFEIASR